MNENLIIPANYKSYLDIVETERAIKIIKDHFQTRLAKKLGLCRVTAPLFVRAREGINDDLNGVERPVSFNVRGADDLPVEIVQSLAKWKRMALAKYRFVYPMGIYTDMNAIRPDETLDNMHSIYVDQWDWEKIIKEEDRNLDYLKNTVKDIYFCIKETEEYICSLYDHISPILPDDIKFVHSEELLEMYSDLSPFQREKEICKKFKAVFLIGIGADLKDGKPHDKRAPDYDDWTSVNGPEGYRGLNGDILVYNPVLNIAFEISSMGIRVDKKVLKYQLGALNSSDRLNLFYHNALMEDRLPLTIGGGIGQSRLCMIYLRKAHIGEIQAGIWSKRTIDQCRENGIFLL